MRRVWETCGDMVVVTTNICKTGPLQRMDLVTGVSCQHRKGHKGAHGFTGSAARKGKPVPVNFTWKD